MATEGNFPKETGNILFATDVNYTMQLITNQPERRN